MTKRSMAFVACWIVFCGVRATAQESPNLLTCERPGAGVPAGWHMSHEGIAWSPGTNDGPFGPGAAHLVLETGARMELDGPARLLESGRTYTYMIWARSDPPGAQIDLDVFDNRVETSLLSQRGTLTSDWTAISVTGELPPSRRGDYFPRLCVFGEPGSVWLDGFWLGVSEPAPAPDWKPPVHDAAVVLEPTTPWGVVTGNEPFAVHARVAGIRANDWKLALRLVSTSGATAELPPLPLDAAPNWEQTFPITGPITTLFGVLRVEARVVGAAGVERSLPAETLLAHVPEPVPGPRPDSPFGVHVALREPDVAAVARLGYKWCRIHDAAANTKWGFAEPEPGRWVWGDDTIALARAQGLSVLGMLDGAPPWASGDTDQGYWSIYGAPKNVDDWRNYVRNMVAHHAGVIDEWEVWNEPWNMQGFFQGGTPMLYVTLLRAAYEEAKKANPACTIVGVDTYPPMWDTAVLALGAYPWYDVLSWHRYDPMIQSRPGDSISRVTRRLERAQSIYGAPKPQMMTEGGPDVTPFHGSFFSFADTAVVGDWSRGADRYARLFLSIIASGTKRCIAYSVHNDPRHGLQTHMMTEPGFLVRPMHAALAGLAHFTEGARYTERTRPAPDASAFFFEQNETRPWADGPATLAVLISDGEEDIPLLNALPDGVRAYDRWANPADLPRCASRSPMYLVAQGDAATALRTALAGAPPAPAGALPPIDKLLEATARALSGGEPALWTRFSVQNAVFILDDGAEILRVDRPQLREDAALAPRLRLAPELAVTDHDSHPAGALTLGTFRLRAPAGAAWSGVYTATPDHPEGGWRFLSLSLLPGDGFDAAAPPEPVDALVRRYERGVREGTTRELHGCYAEGPGCYSAATVNGEYLVCREAENLVTMMDTAVMWGGAARSDMAFDHVCVTDRVAMLSGRWTLTTLTFGAAPYVINATCVREGDDWKFASLTASAGPPPVR